MLVGRIPFFLGRVKPGDVVAFRHPDYGTMIKKVAALVPGEQLFVVGTGRHSVDSRLFGPIGPDALLGRVLWHLPRKSAPRSD